MNLLDNTLQLLGYRAFLLANKFFEFFEFFEFPAIRNIVHYLKSKK